MLREQARRDEATRETNTAPIGELYAELTHAHGFTMPVGNMRAAVNDAFVAMVAPLKGGDEVTFNAPVAGG